MRTEYRMRDMVFYDADGNEISDEELPWSSNTEESDPCDDSQDWVYQDDGDSVEDAVDTSVLVEKSKGFSRGHTLRCRTQKARGAERARGGASQAGAFSSNSSRVPIHSQLV